jgi:hypothetical protein
LSIFLIIRAKDTYIPLRILSTSKVGETEENGNGRTEMTTVKVPKALMERIEALLRTRGYVSRSEYVRTAIQKQLASDEGKP